MQQISTLIPVIRFALFVFTYRTMSGSSSRGVSRSSDLLIPCSEGACGEKFGYIGLADNLDVGGVTPPEINKVRNMGAHPINSKYDLIPFPFLFNMENKENGDGWGTTPEIHISAENKNIAFVEDTECQLFAVNKPLSIREWLPLMGATLPSTLPVNLSP